MAIRDLDGDGKLDLVTTMGNPNGVTVSLNLGNGAFAAPALYQTNFSLPYSLAVGDLDGDGRPDVAIPDSTAQVTIFLNQGNGTFGAATDFPLNNGAQSLSVAIGDLNGDGRADIAAANPPQKSVSVLLGQCM